jgi:hypothetical protein
VSLNKEKVSREISENKIAVCEKTQGLRSGNFSDLNSACSTVLVPVKIFQFQDMHYENRFLGTFQGHRHSKRPNNIKNMLANYMKSRMKYCFTEIF